MAVPRWERSQQLFEAALRYTDHRERAAFLAEACADDPELHREVASLLDAFEKTGPFDDLADAWMPAQVAAGVPPAAGSRVDRYRIVRQIGEGGMGAVYLAERDDPQLRQRVALKLVRPGLDQAQILRRFLSERQILARLAHPNIARLLDGGVSATGLPYFAMEYVEGTPVDRYCDAQGLDVVGRLRLFVQVCEAVEYAHRMLVVHRDLKPSNILVTADGQVKLLDFGIAKLLDSDTGTPEVLTRTGMRVMTPEYAAPEQVRGEPVSTASDVYALGVLLYELLVGRRPYQVSGLSPGEVERVICEEEPRRPSLAVTFPTGGHGARRDGLEHLSRQLRGDLDTIVLKALQKEPARRYGSADQLAADVRRYLEGRPVLARPDTFAYRAGKFVRRHRLGVAAAVLTGLSLLAGIAGTTWQAHRATEHARIAGVERDRARLEAAKAERVSTLLIDLFRGSDPTETLGDTVTVAEVLQRGVERTRTELEAFPEVQTELMDVIGQVYENLGRYDAARPIFEQALAIRLRHYGDAHPDVAESLHHLADVLLEERELDAADSLYRRALAIRQARLGPEHVDVATNLDHLADVLLEKGDYDAADSLYRQALAIRRRQLEPEHEDIATSLNSVATALYFKGDYEAAEPLFREALAIRRKRLPPLHPDVATSVNNLALLLHDRGDLDGAEAHYREALDIRRKVLGDAHPRVTINMSNLAYVLFDRGDLSGAEALYEEVLAIRRKVFGADHPEVAMVLNNLGRVRQGRGDLAGAAALHRQALAIRRRHLGKMHPYVAVSLNNLGGVLSEQGEVQAAADTFREALAIRRQTLPPDHPDIPLTQSNLGDCLRRLRQFPEAEALLLDAYTRQKDRLGPTDARTQTTVQRLVDLFEAWQKPEQAQTYRDLLVAER